MPRNKQSQPVLSPKQSADLQLELNKVRSAVRNEMKKLSHPKLTPIAKALLGNLALPADAPAVRIGSAHGSDPTALANLRSRDSIKFPVVGGVTADLPTTDHVTFCFRDPLRHIVMSTGLGPADVTSYEAQFALNVTASNAEFYPDYFSGMKPNSADNTAVHGPELYFGIVGESDQHRGVFCTRGSQINIQITTALPAGATEATVSVKRLEGKNWQVVAKINFAAALPSITSYSVPSSGYYTWALNVIAPAALPAGTATTLNGYAGVYLDGTGRNMIWAHKAAPQMSDFARNVETFAVLGSSVMYTNTASPLNRQGKIVARELPAKTYWEKYLNFDEVSNLSQAVVKDAPEGLYAFTRPAGEDFGRFRTAQYEGDIVTATNPNIEHLYNLYPEEPYVVVHAQVTTTAGQDFYLSRSISLEYTTTSMFIEQKQGAATVEDIDQALKLLSLMPQFHDNPFHFEDVWDWIKSTAKDVWGAVKEVAPIALAAAPLLL